MAKTVICPAGQRIDFPHRCLRCGAVPTATWSCVARRGVDLFLVKFGRAQHLAIPVCTQCWTIRRTLGSLAMILIAASLLAAVGLMLPWLDGEDLTGLWFGLVFLAVVALVYYGRNQHGRWADRFLLRVSAPRIRPDDSVELRIADDALAAGVTVTGTAGIESFDSIEHIVFAGAETALTPDTDTAGRYGFLDRMARHQVIGPRVGPACGILASLASLAANHWYALTQHHYYPAVLYVMGPVLLLGLGGLFHPSVFFARRPNDGYSLSRRRARVFLITLGFGLAVFLHGWLYQFNMKLDIPLPRDAPKASH